jgi:hypothetical protein
MKQPTREVPTELAVFQHEKRLEWGLGILAWEKTHKRGYLFENGQLRILSQDFYSMMREVDRPRDEVQALFAALKPDLEAAAAEEGLRPPTRRATPTAISFDDQLSVFRTEYPGGFADDAWIDSQRGTNATKLLTRHRDPAISKAAARLSAPDLEARVAQQQFRAVTDDVVAVLRQTDLVPGADLADLKTDDDKRRGALAAAVCELLHGQTPFDKRFDRFINGFERAFGRVPGWQLATALPALLYPKEHICVRPTSFREQAKLMAPRLAIAKVPTAANYARCLAMAVLVSSKLHERGESPRDLMDVYDFMRLTTRPAAKALLSKLRAKARQTAVTPKPAVAP